MKINIPKIKQKIAEQLDYSLFRNSINLIVAQFSIALLGFAFWGIVARFYTSENVGLASVIISFINLLAMLSLFGFNISIVRFLPTYKEKLDMINSYFNLGLAVAFIVSIIFLAGLQYWSPKFLFIREKPLFEIFFIVVTGICTSNYLLSSIFMSDRAAIYILLKELTSSVSRIPLAILLLTYGSLGIFISWGFGSLIGFAMGLILLIKIIPNYHPTLVLKTKIIKYKFSYTFGNYIASLLGSLPGYMLPILITNITSLEFAAYFYISWMLSNLLFAIPLQVAQSLFAEGSNIEDHMDENIRKSIKFIFLLIIPLIVFISFFGNSLLEIFGKEYAIHGCKLLQLLAFSAIPYTFNMIYIAVERIKRNVGIIVTIWSIIVIVTLGGSYFLVPDKGLIAIGIAWNLGNFLALIAVALHAMAHKTKLFER